MNFDFTGIFSGISAEALEYFRDAMSDLSRDSMRLEIKDDEEVLIIPHENAGKISRLIAMKKRRSDLRSKIDCTLSDIEGFVAIINGNKEGKNHACSNMLNYLKRLAANVRDKFVKELENSKRIADGVQVRLSDDSGEGPEEDSALVAAEIDRLCGMDEDETLDWLIEQLDKTEFERPRFAELIETTRRGAQASIKEARSALKVPEKEAECLSIDISGLKHELPEDQRNLEEVPEPMRISMKRLRELVAAEPQQAEALAGCSPAGCSCSTCRAESSSCSERRCDCNET